MVISNFINLNFFYIKLLKKYINHYKLQLIIFIPFLFFILHNHATLQSIILNPYNLSVNIFLDTLIISPLFLIALLAISFKLGHFIVVLICRDFVLSEQIIFSIPIGLCLISFLVFLFGILGLLKVWLFVIILLAILPFAIRHTLLFLRKIKSKYHGLDMKNFITIPETVCLGIIAWVLVCGFFNASVPPTDWDVLNYHFAIPQDFAREGKIYFREDSLFWCFPSNIDMLYVLSFLIKGETLALLISYMFGILLAIELYLFGQRILNNRKISIVSVALLVIQPIFRQFLGSGTKDIILALYVLLSLHCIIIATEKLDWRYSILAGIFSGLAVGTKYIGLIFGLVLFIFLFFLQVKNNTIRGLIKNLSFYVLSLIMTCFPWYLRNYIWTGNPIWPLFNPIFGNPYLSLENYHLLCSVHVPIGFDNVFKGFFRLIYFLLNDKYSILRHCPECFTWSFIGILSITLLLRPKIPHKLTIIFIFSLACLLLIFLSGYISCFWRHFLPLLPILCLVLAWGIDFLSTRNIIFAWFIILMLVLCALRKKVNPDIFSTAMGISFSNSISSVRDQFLERNTTHYSIYKKIYELTPKDAKILLIWPLDHYNLRRKYVDFDSKGKSIPNNGYTIENCIQMIKNLQTTYILCNDEALTYEGVWNLGSSMKTVILEHSKCLYSCNGYSLYELNL